MKNDKTPFLLKFVRWFFPKLERFAPPLAHQYFIKIFFTPLRYPIPEKEREILQQASQFEVVASDKKIQCYSWGEGPIVLLVHGWAGRATQFRKFIPVLNRAGYKAVAFDGPAHGNSAGKSTTILEFEEALKKVYEKVGEPVAIIAHSFGGGAVLFAAMNGLPVKKLINIASPTIGDEIINTYLRTINGSSKTGDFFRSYMLKNFGKSFDEFTATHFIKNIKQDIKLLLVHDEDDRDVSIDQAHALLKLYPQGRIYQTKGLGHTRILRDEKVIETCVTFVNDSRQ